MPSPRESLSPAPALFRRLLMEWYGRSGRHDLPWRRTWSPYHVLVSEFMLQQTTVAAVIPYYQRFLKEFPTLEDLARAPLDRVLELWSGLGYYARARNLHAAAIKLAGEHGGRLPEGRDAVEELPGVGRYTAGALLSFAYDKPEALVDGNVVRVLSRIYGIRENVKDPRVAEALWGLSWKLIPAEGARHFNSALMDLGATLCRPSGPDCLVCPFFKDCWARRHGRQEDIPLAAADRPRKEVQLHAALLSSQGRWGLVKRPAKGLYGGLWEFPNTEAEGKKWTKGTAGAFLQDFLGFSIRLEGALPSLKHVLSHREFHIHPWLCAPARARPALEGGGWYSLEEIEGMGISALTRRVLESLRKKDLAKPLI